MLVSFYCKTHADVVLFGEVALQFLKWMGHSGTVPGAILADEVPQALGRLQAALEQGRQSEVDCPAEEAEEQVSLKVRAVPFLNLLNSAVKDHCDVMWKAL